MFLARNEGIPMFRFIKIHRIGDEPVESAGDRDGYRQIEQAGPIRITRDRPLLQHEVQSKSKNPH